MVPDSHLEPTSEQANADTGSSPGDVTPHDGARSSPGGAIMVGGSGGSAPPPRRPHSGRFLRRMVAWALFGLACGLAGGAVATFAVPYIWPAGSPSKGSPPTTSLPGRILVESTPAEDAAKLVGPAVVGVISQQRQSGSWGSTVATSIGTGVLFDGRGYVVTNDHVIAPGVSVQVELPDGRRESADVTGADPQTDLAVLRIKPDRSLKVAGFADSGQVHVGQPVIAIGNPLGLNFQRSVTSGVVSGIRQALYGYTVNRGATFDPSRQRVTELIQTDAAINRGNSGGPLVDAAGRVIGINTLKSPVSSGAEGMGFAIPSNIVKRVVGDLIRYGHVRRAYLGVSFPFQGRDPITGDPEVALSISSVVPESPAAAAGLQPGDRVEVVDGKLVRDYIQLIGILEMHHPGDVITVTVVRGGAHRTFRVHLGQALEEGSH